MAVYFRVFDVDDPFDQFHGPQGADPDPDTPENEAFIADVDVIDGDMNGPDNRGSAEPS